MTPAARTQAAIDLLDAIVAAADDNGAAADTLITRYFAQRRYAGSKDRRAVRELVYAAIRLLGERPSNGRAAMVALARTDPAIADTFDGSTHAPAPIEPTEAGATPGTAPAWLIERLSASGLDHAEQAALTGRAPLDVRVNTLRTTPETLASELIDAHAIVLLPNALRLPAGTDLAPFAGRLEVQDAGSQVVTLAAEAQPEHTVIDLCAGAGGKSLALAATMENRGRIVASDVDRARLRRLEPRAIAAGATIIEPLLLDAGHEAEALAPLAGAADTVLIDAPCSGTGTWRRNPEARWRLTRARIDRFVATQRHVLALGAPLVKPGGTLVYIVCSLLDAEGRDQVDAFLADHPGWDAEPLSLPLGRAHGRGVRLTPAHDGSDGFFVARLRAPC